MPRVTNEKEWEWALNVHPDKCGKNHLQLAYRLNSTACNSKPNPCKRNCRLNPKCIFGLGEKRWLVDKSDDQWACSDDPELQRRDDGSFAGLKNLGATCYVNSLLQVWFHNPSLRKAIYEWNPNEDPKEPNTYQNGLMERNSEFKPTSPIGQLQLIFARLQFSYNFSVDPTPFVKSLDLDVSQQQDAQEFCKLFLNLLEVDLSNQSNSFVKNIVQKEYCGQYAYVTKCKGCGTESRSPSDFYELSLNIRGHKEVKECLAEFFAAEELSGADQYHCQTCKSKQDATRQIEITKLPPILNLQLLRFIYDRQNACRKKLNSFIKFSETLEISQDYISSKCSKPVSYSLCAVLVHHGQSAHAGHYIAHIKDSKTDSWFKFNDEKVDKIEGNKLKLGQDENVEENGHDENNTDNDKQPPKLIKGQHASKNAYMLVYKSNAHEPDSSYQWEQLLPEYLAASMAEEKSNFDSYIQDMKEIRAASVLVKKQKQSSVKEIFNALQYKEGEPSDWVNKEWLSKWLQSDDNQNVLPFDNASAFCTHNKLALHSIKSMKCVKSEGARLLYDRFGGGPRLEGDVLCRACVIQKIRDVRLQAEIHEDHKEVTKRLKFTTSLHEKSFWIGKESLRTWKTMALAQVAPEPASPADDSNGSDSDVQIVAVEKPVMGFNQDLLCVHDELCGDESRRRVISRGVWTILRKYFPDAREFSSDCSICPLCAEDQEKSANLKSLQRNSAQEQKNLLGDLYAMKRRPSLPESDEQVTYYAVSHDFFKLWQRFIKDPTHYNAPSALCNASLLCELHGRLCLPLLGSHEPGAEDYSTRFVLLHAAEWKILSARFSADQAIEVHIQSRAGGEPKVVSEPPFCNECFLELVAREKEERLNYKNATIYVRKIQTKCEPDDTQENVNGDDDNNDKEFPGKRQKPNGPGEGAPGDLRRSRRRKYRDEKEFIVSSDNTLKDLKVKIMEHFKVAPYDQHLSLDDVPLENNDKTLAQLNVYPGSLLMLRVDEAPNIDCIPIEDDDKGTRPEGFKGTLLVQCNSAPHKSPQTS